MSAPPGRLHPAAPPPPPPPARRRRRPVLRYVSAAVFTLLAAVFALPDLFFGLDGRSPFAQLVSFRPLIIAGGAVLLVLLLVLLFFVRRAWPFAAGLLVVLLIGSGMVLPRMIADPLPTGGTPITVLAFNAYEGSADIDALTELIRTERPDIISVEEAGEKFRSRLAPLVEPLGYQLKTSTGPRRADVGGVTAVVANGLGDVDFRIGDETSSFPYVEVSGGALGPLRFVAFHSVAPVPGFVPDWRHDLSLLRQWCAGPGPAIVAGDFNATLDHSALRSGMAGCGDAADQRGDGLVPTWGPTPRTRVVGPQIDHVLATDGIEAQSFSVHDIPGSDHRAVLSTLRVPSS